LQTKVVKKIEAQILFNGIKEKRTVYEIMWQNIEPERPQMTV
jgi:hypothetical protein